MKKILIVVTDTDVGGITTAVYNFIDELYQKGNDVTFLDFSAQDNNPHINSTVKQIHLQGISKYWKLNKHTLDNVPFIQKPFFAALGIVKKITNRNGTWNNLIFKKLPEEYDIAIAYRQCSPCYSFVLNKVKADKKICFIHGDIDFMDDVSSWQPMMYQFDKNAYVSNSAKRNFIRNYPNLTKNACTVYNMFNYWQIKEKSLLPNNYVITHNVKNIVTVARIDNTSKQIDWIPCICNKIREQTNVNFHWYVLGDGPDMDYVKELSRRNATDDVLSFIGNVENPYSILRTAYLGVLTSKTEGYPMVVMETLSLGVPMVVTHYDSAPEQINDGADSLIAEVQIDSVVNLIIDMLENRDGIYDKCKQALLEREFNNDLSYSQFMDCI